MQQPKKSSNNNNNNKQAKNKPAPMSVNTGAKTEKTVKAPAAMGFETATTFTPVAASRRFKDGVVVEGSDHLEFVIIPSGGGGVVAGQVLNEIYINPSEFGGTRLEKFAALYEKYLFEVLEFEYLPAVGSDKPGAIVLAYDRDISDPTPPPTEQGVREFTSFEGSRDGNIWIPHRVRCKLQAPDAGYYTNPVVGGDDRLAYQGQFYVAVTVPTASSGTIGRLRLNYRCHFFVPQLSNANMVAEGYSTFGGPFGPTVAPADFMYALKQFTGPVWKGIQQWLPKLDSNGKYYIELAQGLYKMASSIYETTTSGSTATATNTNSVLTPTVVPNEPAPAAAPQPFVEASNVMMETMNTGDLVNGLLGEFYLGVPRGGAKVYQTYDYPTGASGGSTNLLFDMVLERLGGYQPTSGMLFLARWQGREECEAPHKHRELAHSRSTKRLPPPPPRLAAQAQPPPRTR